MCTSVSVCMWVGEWVGSCECVSWCFGCVSGWSGVDMTVCVSVCSWFGVVRL